MRSTGSLNKRAMSYIAKNRPRIVARYEVDLASCETEVGLAWDDFQKSSQGYGALEYYKCCSFILASSALVERYVNILRNMVMVVSEDYRAITERMPFSKVVLYVGVAVEADCSGNMLCQYYNLRNDISHRWSALKTSYGVSHAGAYFELSSRHDAVRCSNAFLLNDIFSKIRLSGDACDDGILFCAEEDALFYDLSSMFSAYTQEVLYELRKYGPANYVDRVVECCTFSRELFRMGNVVGQFIYLSGLPRMLYELNQSKYRQNSSRDIGQEIRLPAEYENFKFDLDRKKLRRVRRLESAVLALIALGIIRPPKLNVGVERVCVEFGCALDELRALRSAVNQWLVGRLAAPPRT